MMAKCISPAKLVTPNEMDHNKYDIFKDIIYNIKDFFSIFLDDPFDSRKSERISLKNTTLNTIRKNFFINKDVIEFPNFMFENPNVKNKL